MTRSRRSVLGMMGAVPAAMLVSSGTAEAGIPDDLRPGGSYDRFVAQLAAEDKFSGTVLLSHRGRPVLSRAYGMADKQLSIPNQVDTIFALASASKPFTALAILQLAQQGKISFYDTLGTHLDGFPAEIAGTVTIHHLLTHTSGMGDLLGNQEFMAKAGTWTSADEVMTELMKIIRKEPLAFTPGTNNRYSNNGYDTLGAIVAKVSGKPFYDYVREHIFAVAGMTRTGFYTRPEWLSDRRIAHPYTMDTSGQRVDAVRTAQGAARMFIGTGGGNGFSTAPDLVRFACALTDGKLLNPTYTELYMSPKVPQRPRGAADPAFQSFIAYGAPAPIANNHRLFTHGGGAAGESTNWTIYRDLDWCGVILSNYDQIDLAAIIDRERNPIVSL
ncbi:CubicO group peptidase (beta-lactamase class C family) [Kibdelosporangium banguiense]|uniref:CubicO group peptidase (Beta-lactamase class C family) n=1 Tax=Kibdelosporangium banguiense TaxID=1365924 RepID=A0ABS4TRF3_9PSEU|nr:serine hydrolase domain-containing protein [Kibdelosporangium banguiense]MBP2326976.1 CubicO group peptidase (beta-lactamase class C family) [Kibdelosporangium banguiense]